MAEALDIAPAHRAIVREVLEAAAPRPSRVWAFGSRADGRARATSDLDLAVDAGRPLTLDERAELREAFTQSALPWRVDVVDLATVSDGFQDRVRETAKLFLMLPSDPGASSQMKTASPT